MTRARIKATGMHLKMATGWSACMSFLTDLSKRGSVAQLTHLDECEKWLAQAPRSFYLGIDPTAASLHVGHLAPLNTARLLQQAGHHAVLVLGGGTARIGDPSMKTQMRSMLTAEQIAHNSKQICTQIHSLLPEAKHPVEVVDNSIWLNSLNYLDFLRDVGQHFSVNRMLTAECFKNRMEKGLSFLEFNYMLLQSYDFYYLAEHQQVLLQIGGDDQWSHMLAGADLIRRMLKKQAYVLTTPLLVNQSGLKMGKTEKGAVWLDAARTTPLEFFQYFRNLDDGDVLPAYRLLTDLSPQRLKELEELLKPGATADVWAEAKSDLAEHVSTWVHGREEARRVRSVAQELYSPHVSQDSASALMDPVLLPSEWLMGPSVLPIQQVLVAGGVASSNKEARRLIVQGGITLAGQQCQDPQKQIDISALQGKGLVVSKGKKKFFLLKISPHS